MYKVVVLLGLCLAVASAKPTVDKSMCIANTQETLWNESLNTLGNLATCSVTGILENLGDLLIDTAQFGNSTWDDAWDILNDLGGCFTESGLIGQVECLYNTIADSSDEFHSIMEATKVFIKNADTIASAIESEINECFGKSVSDYKVLVNDLVKKSKSC